MAKQQKEIEEDMKPTKTQQKYIDRAIDKGKVNSARVIPLVQNKILQEVVVKNKKESKMEQLKRKHCKDFLSVLGGDNHIARRDHSLKDAINTKIDDELYGVNIHDYNKYLIQ